MTDELEGAFEVTDMNGSVARWMREFADKLDAGEAEVSRWQQVADIREKPSTGIYVEHEHTGHFTTVIDAWAQP